MAEVLMMEKRSTVMVVDDDVMFNQSLVFLLECLRVEAVQADAALQALKIILTTDIDIEISDVYMPGMNGLELLRKIKQLKPDLPVILISGNPDATLAEKAARGGAIGFFPKPLSRARLTVMLREVISLKEPKEPASRA